MARLVIGTSKAKTVPAVVRDMSPEHYIEKTVDANGVLRGGSMIVDLSGVTDVESYVLAYAYYGNGNITGVVNASDLVSITGSGAFTYAFYNCTRITGIDFSSLESSTGVNAFSAAFQQDIGLTAVSFPKLKEIKNNNNFQYTFKNCTNLVTADFPLLRIVDGWTGFSNTFEGCGSLTTLNIPKLEIATSQSSMSSLCSGCASLTNFVMPSLVFLGHQGGMYMLRNCTHLTNLVFSSLSTLSGQSNFLQMCQGCTGLVSILFPALRDLLALPTYTNQFNNMLAGVTGCTVHFPSNMQTTVSGLTGYPNFGGTNTTVLFDLPATNILTGADTVEYERSPKDDTATALAWRVKDTGTAPNISIDWTPYYTSGTSDPTTGATIYSDSSCTTAVTTISSIV